MISRFKKVLENLLINTTVNLPFSEDLSGQVIIITGASRGIGKAIAETVSNYGACVVLVSRTKEELEKVFANFGQQNTLLVKADVSSAKDVDNIIEQVIKKFGRVDVLINNAGHFIEKPLEQVSEAEFSKIIETNLKGTFLMSKAVIPLMKKQKSGLILNIGSKISHNTNVAPNKVLYATSKYAIEGFSFALNKELKPFGIRVSCLMPGTVNTFISRQAKKYMSPYQIGQIVLMMIKFQDIDFESIVFKSRYQNI